ncbi:MAG: hypothetical protein ACFCVA_18305, partial [Gammaproteobacteria bacterium]
ICDNEYLIKPHKSHFGDFILALDKARKVNFNQPLKSGLGFGRNRLSVEIRTAWSALGRPLGPSQQPLELDKTDSGVDGKK